MQVSLGELTARLGGELIGDPQLTISRIGPLQTAGPDTLSFLSQARYAQQLAVSRAACVIVWVYFRIGTPEAAKHLAPSMKLEPNFGPRNMGAGPSGIGAMNIKTGTLKHVISVPFQVGHIQTNPWVAGEIVFLLGNWRKISAENLDGFVGRNRA